MCPWVGKVNFFSSWTMALSRTPRGTSSTLTTSLTNPYEDLSNYIDIHEYLATTNRLPPEHALQAEEEGYETASEEMLEYDPPEADPTAVRRAFTDKLIKTMHMSFNQFSRTDVTPWRAPYLLTNKVGEFSGKSSAAVPASPDRCPPRIGWSSALTPTRAGTPSSLSIGVNSFTCLM